MLEMDHFVHLIICRLSEKKNRKKRNVQTGFDHLSDSGGIIYIGKCYQI